MQKSESISIQKKYSTFFQGIKQLHRAERLPVTRPSRINEHSNSGLSNVIVKPLNYGCLNKLEDKDLVFIADKLTDFAALYDSNILDWTFDIDNDTIITLIHRCMIYLYESINLNEIIFYKDESSIKFELIQPLNYKTVCYAIPLLKVYSLKQKSIKIYKILMGFIQSLPVINFFNDDYHTEMIKEWMISCYDEELESEGYSLIIKENYDSLFISKKTITAINNFKCDWLSLLDTYNPKNTIYSSLIELIKKGVDIDFNLIHQVHSANNYDYCEEEGVSFSDTFLIVDETESAFTKHYVDYINDISNNYGNKEICQSLLIEKKTDLKKFDESVQNRIYNIQSFFNQLINLLNSI